MKHRPKSLSIEVKVSISIFQLQRRVEKPLQGNKRKVAHSLCQFSYGEDVI